MTDKITILIVDDEIVSRYTMKALLESEKYTLVFAENGKEGLDKAQMLSPDLIFLDVMMNDMSGFEVCKQLRKTIDSSYIVMITAWDDPAARQYSLKCGANAIVHKPFKRDELYTQIQNFMTLFNKNNKNQPSISDVSE
jgi:CheY-like chemotaxis protein